jgi:DNA polymerase III subunit delta'
MWQGILGHDAVLEQFRHSLAQGRLASSYLFLGPSGVGKRAFALKLAQALLCQTRDETELDPCGQCEACLLAVAGNHPDLDVVQLPEDKRRLPLELFLGDREHRNQEGLCHNISLRPMLGRRRVAVIDDADYLTIESSNCLLKTLEEPPPGAVLILLATSRGRLLPTILSRTQVVRFAPLETEAIEQLLVERQIATDPQQARLLVTHCQGSLERARELADPAWWELRQWLPTQLALSRWDSFRLAERIHEFVNQAGQSADARRQRMRAVFQMVAAHFQELLHHACQVGMAKSAPITEAARQAKEMGPSAQQCAISAIDRCLEAEVELDRNANQATLLECWLDDLATIVRAPLSGALV